MAAQATPAAASTALVSEMMAQGRKSAAALEALLQVQDLAGIRELTAEILRCCDRALAVLHGTGRKKRKSGHDDSAATQTTRPKRRTRANRREAAATTRVERKRNRDDGFLWRKYGEKVIRGSGHPRHYFRCAYTLDAGGCPARRQVQRSEQDDDPYLYVITYFGYHTCCHHGVEAIAGAALDDVKMHQSLVLDFGLAVAGSRSPRPDGDARSVKTSRSAEFAAEVTKVESTPSSGSAELAAEVTKVESTPKEELSSSANDVRCSSSLASAAWDPSATACSDWDHFSNCSFDYVSEFFECTGTRWLGSEIRSALDGCWTRFRWWLILKTPKRRRIIFKHQEERVDALSKMLS